MSTQPQDRYEKMIQRAFVTVLKKASIPLFNELAQDPNILSNYFSQRRSLYYLMLGSNAHLMDDALVNALTDEIVRVISDLTLNGKSAYPGFWNDRNIGIIVSRLINATQPTDEPDGEFYLTWRTPNSGCTKADLQKDPYTFAFSQYTPQKLYDLCTFIQDNVSNTILDEVLNNYPTALLHNNKETLYERYARELSQMLKEPMKEFKAWRHSNPTAGFEEISKSFGNITNRYVIGYISALIANSGFSEMGAAVLGKCTVNSIIGTANVNRATADDFASQQNKITYRVITTPEMGITPMAQSMITQLRVADILAITDTKAKAAVVNKAIPRIGKAIETAVENLVHFITIVSIANTGLLVKMLDFSKDTAAEAEEEPAKTE